MSVHKNPTSLLRRVITVLRWLTVVSFLLTVPGVAAFKIGWLGNPWARFEKSTLNPGFRSASASGEPVFPFRRVIIQSGARRLEGILVLANSACKVPVAVLIVAGRGETTAEWARAQQEFRRACITSLSFDYSGIGHSDGPGTIRNLNGDAVAAYWEMVKLTPTSRHCLVSHSMGGGPMLSAASAPGITPDCIVLASPFRSLTTMAEREGMPKLFGDLMPAAWDNEDRIRKIHASLLWIHSRDDQTIPISEGQAVYEAAPEPKVALVVAGLGHNAIYTDLPSSIWTPMILFIRSDKGVQ